MSKEQAPPKDPYRGLNPVQLQEKFRILCYQLPGVVTDKELQQTFTVLFAPLDNPDDTSGIHETVPGKRRISPHRALFMNHTQLLLGKAVERKTITNQCAEYITSLFGQNYQLGIPREELEDPNNTSFPNYLMEQNSPESGGLFESLRGKELERIVYKRRLAIHLENEREREEFFGTEAMEKFREKVRRGEHPPDPQAEGLERQRQEFSDLHAEEI